MEKIMEIQTSEAEGVLVVAIIGRLDAGTTPEFQEAGNHWGDKPVVLDLTRLEYISSMGLRVFVYLKRQHQKKGIPLVLAGSSELVDRILTLSGFEQVFTRYSTVPEALKGISTEKI